MGVRINTLATAASPANDDYIVLDGATNGTRKVLATNIGETMYDFTGSSVTINANGTSGGTYIITPVDTTNISVDNILKMSAYLVSGSAVYPLIVTYAYAGSATIHVILKCIYASTQASTLSTVTGTLHVVAPFEISSISAGM